MRDVFEKATIGVAPHSGPINPQAPVGENVLYEWDIDAVQVNLAVSESTFVVSPIIPKVLDNLAAYTMSRFEVARRCWVNDGSI